MGHQTMTTPTMANPRRGALKRKVRPKSHLQVARRKRPRQEEKSPLQRPPTPGKGNPMYIIVKTRRRKNTHLLRKGARRVPSEASTLSSTPAGLPAKARRGRQRWGREAAEKGRHPSLFRQIQRPISSQKAE